MAVRHASAPPVVSQTACDFRNDGEQQENGVKNPDPRPRLRQKQKRGKKQAYANPTSDGAPDHESSLARPLRILDTEIRANQSPGDPHEGADNATNDAWIHILSFVLRFSVSRITMTNRLRAARWTPIHFQYLDSEPVRAKCPEDDNPLVRG